MPLSGEAIRTMNYVDDISVTLRRILTGVATLDDDVRAIVSAHLAQAKPSAQDVLDALAADFEVTLLADATGGRRAEDFPPVWRQLETAGDRDAVDGADHRLVHTADGPDDVVE